MPKTRSNSDNQNTSKKVIAVVVLLALIIVAFFMLKPFIIAILSGLILAYILAKPYKWLNKLIKKPSISAILICLIVIIVLAVSTYFVAQIAIKESFNLYMQIQHADLYTTVNDFLSKFLSSPEVARQITLTIQQAATSLISSFTDNVGNILINSPSIILQFFVAFFSTYYFLKDGDKIKSYIFEILPFNQSVKEKLMKRSQEVTYATIYGQVIVGIIQGAVAGIGFYVFGAPSPLFFSLLAILFSIIPHVGPAFVWVPVSLYMIATGNNMMGILLLLFGVIVVSWIDNVLRPYLVGRRGKINPGIAMIGILGGLVVMGPVGVVIGPLILEYLLIFIELYRTGEIKIFD